VYLYLRPVLQNLNEGVPMRKLLVALVSTDADTNQWIENFPTGTDAHSVTVNPVNNQIFVPIENPNPLCGTLPGCVSVFTTGRRGEGW
jgi:hypothetical protein